MTKKKAKIFDDSFIDKLCMIPDLLFAEDMDTLSKAKLVLVMQALDESSDYINDYLTENHYTVQHSYPDISDLEQ